jgi:hypothetical protein
MQIYDFEDLIIPMTITAFLFRKFFQSLLLSFAIKIRLLYSQDLLMGLSSCIHVKDLD